jgi:hypothetical protein
MHFKTGKKGKLARFFAKMHAARDPFDETVVLPSLIFLFLLKLYELGRINAWAFGAGLIIPASLAGLWIGSCLGDRGIFRAALRGVLVGAIEGAGFAAIVKETITQSGALQSGLNLIYINVVFFWLFSAIGASVSNIATLSEEDWQRRRRAFSGRTPRDYTKLQRYHRKTFDWFSETLLLTFSPANVARPLLYFFIGIPIFLVLWIVYGINPYTAIASFFETGSG